VLYLFIDLSTLCRVFHRSAEYMATQGFLKISRQVEKGQSGLVAQWIPRNGAPFDLPILGLPEFLGSLKDFLWMHR